MSHQIFDLSSQNFAILLNYYLSNFNHQRLCLLLFYLRMNLKRLLYPHAMTLHFFLTTLMTSFQKNWTSIAHLFHSKTNFLCKACTSFLVWTRMVWHWIQNSESHQLFLQEHVSEESSKGLCLSIGKHELGFVALEYTKAGFLQNLKYW